MGHALIVDHDAESARGLADAVAGRRFTVATAAALGEARRQLALHRPDLVLVAASLPDGSADDLLATPELLADIEIVLLAAAAAGEPGAAARRLGADGWLVKPVDPQQLDALLARVRRRLHSARAAPEASDGDAHFGALWGRSAPMLEVYRQLERVAPTSVSVFVTGESGTGKEVVARTLHDRSLRRSRPFLAVNCGAISPNLIESELFGHEKGSFTGADSSHAGFFERAHGGTLFLDEITEMPLEMQVKLLRVLETGSFLRVGSTQERRADVRVVAASNRRPEEAVAASRLREDLLYRLNVFPIELPPLRARGADVELLAERFLDSIGEREGVSRRLTPAARAALREHRWPGNVRELRNAIQRAYVMADGEEIGAEWLPRGGPPAASSARVQPAVAAPPDEAPRLTVPLGTSMAEAERRLILATFDHFGRHKEQTAAALGLSMKTLYNRLRDYTQGSAAETTAAPPAGA